MRSVAVSAVLFAIVFLLIIFNGIFIKRTLVDIETIAEKIASSPKDAKADSEDLKKIWDKCRTFVELSVEYNQISRMDELLISLEYAVGAKDEKESARLCDLIIELCHEISSHQKLSLQGIL